MRRLACRLFGHVPAWGPYRFLCLRCRLVDGSRDLWDRRPFSPATGERWRVPTDPDAFGTVTTFDDPWAVRAGKVAPP